MENNNSNAVETVKRETTTDTVSGTMQKYFGEVFRQTRKGLGISLPGIAERTGFSVEFIQQIETQEINQLKTYYVNALVNGLKGSYYDLVDPVNGIIVRKATGTNEEYLDAVEKLRKILRKVEREVYCKSGNYVNPHVNSYTLSDLSNDILEVHQVIFLCWEHINLLDNFKALEDPEVDGKIATSICLA